MKFGDTPLDAAEGALLAHSLTAGRVRLRKGQRLGAADVTALREAGITSVTAARLGPDDRGENDAALQAATALCGPGLRVDAPFTGRCNLYAEADGLPVLDRATVDALNGIDESLALATVSPAEPVVAGQLVATVKVVPLAVAGGVLAAWQARAAAAPLRLAPFAPHRVGLLLTRLPGLKESVLDKTAGTIRRRLAACGSAIHREVRCAHALDAVAAALDELRAAGCSPVLAFGASAVVDRRDVLPAAIERCGGRIERLGMPVDPGNLTLLAAIGEVPVLVLPGSARSPRLNGCDFVLWRLLAGLPVGSDDIARMGVGGLLKDVAERPQPRERTAPDASAPLRIAAVVLAAGQSRRMGSANKLLADVGGTPMVRRVVDAVRASGVRLTVVVTGHEADRVRSALDGTGVDFIHNPDYPAGLSTSLAAGIAALPEDCDGALVCLGDMPEVTAAHLDRLIAAFAPGDDRTICVPTRRGKRGNPVLWGRRFFAELRRQSGDVGARHLIGEHQGAVTEVAMDDDAIFLDVDTPEALARLAGGRT